MSPRASPCVLLNEIEANRCVDRGTILEVRRTFTGRDRRRADADYLRAPREKTQPPPQDYQFESFCGTGRATLVVGGAVW
jgi:hypothetical protein